MRWLLGLFAVGCDPDTVDRAYDRDRDGYDAAELGGPDCDDADASVHPDAPEVCANGQDDDCDGTTDDAGTGGPTWYLDADDDGAPGPTPQSGSCAAPTDSFEDLSAGEDCDDTDPDRHPAAEEVWYDDVDQDCDGNDDDADEDAHPAPADCDDTDPGVHPGAADPCDDGVNADCGPTPACSFSGEIAGSRDLMSTVTVVGDPYVANVDGGGRDLVIVGLDRYWWWEGPLQTAESSSTGRWGDVAVLRANLDEAPPAFVSELTGDGPADVAVSEGGGYRVVPGPLPALEWLEGVRALGGGATDPLRFGTAAWPLVGGGAVVRDDRGPTPELVAFLPASWPGDADADAGDRAAIPGLSWATRPDPAGAMLAVSVDGTVRSVTLGSVAAVTTWIGVGPVATDLARADVTGDGVADAIGVVEGVARVVPGPFSALARWADGVALTDAAPAVAVVPCDVDRDGVLDVLVARRGASPQVDVYRGPVGARSASVLGVGADRLYCFEMDTSGFSSWIAVDRSVGWTRVFASRGE